MRKHFVLIIVAVILTIPISQFYGEISLNLITESTQVLYREQKEISLDNFGVPMNDYGYINGVYIGKQRNPVTISHQAFEYWNKFQNGDDKSKKLFLNCADWLVINAVDRENFTVWEYAFPWSSYGLNAPWISGMAQGQGIQVLARAYNLTGDMKYMNIANSSLQSFFIEVKNGGVTYKNLKTGGWWYEEYPIPNDLKEARVLNGFIFALFGIYEYYQITGDEKAKYLFDKGIIELKNHLSDYDTGEWTYYDNLGKHANIMYHNVHTKQMLQLYDITQDPVFMRFYQKWKNYQDNPLVRFNYMNLKEKVVYPFNFLIIFVLIEIIIFASGRLSLK